MSVGSVCLNSALPFSLLMLLETIQQLASFYLARSQGASKTEEWKSLSKHTHSKHTETFIIGTPKQILCVQMPSKGTSKHSKNRKVVCFFAGPSSTKRLFKFDRQLLTLILGENILRPMGSPPNTHGWKMVLKRLTQTSWLKVEKVSLSSLLKRILKCIRKKKKKTPETLQKWYCYCIKKKARTSPIRMRTAFYGRFHVGETQQPVQVGKHPNLHGSHLERTKYCTGCGTKTLGL